MDASDSDADGDRVELLNDLRILAEQAIRSPDGPLTDTASDAVSRLYDRYKSRVYSFCLRRVRFSLPPGCLVEDFVTDLFFRFVRSAGSLVLQNVHSFSDVERQILASFHQHAMWQLRELIRQHKAVSKLVDEMLQDVARRKGMHRPASAERSPNMARLEQALAELDERARDVLLTSYQHLDQAGEFKLPEHVRTALCERCNFKNGNALVKFRSRKIEELRALLVHVA
ncbi:MAG TPA: hypothetical protein VGR35_15540 [Tepidisphaeraceae bacterium]|nr:hypothetical protein [Tepidisphaeraceae bacterium]